MTTDEFSVATFEKYPQFLEADDDADTVRPVTGAPDALEQLKISPSYLNFIRFLFSLIKKLFAVNRIYS